MYIYLVRHGETEWNKQGLLMGHKNSPLTEKGEMQAKELGKKLSTISFDAVYSSDSPRAIETAEIILDKQDHSIKTTSHLRERNFGRFEGKTRAEMDTHTVAFDDLEDSDKFVYKVYPDIESDDELLKRFFIFLEVFKDTNHENVLVVCHGGVIKSILLHLNHLQYDNHKAYSIHSISNSAVVKLHYANSTLSLEETHGIIHT